MIPMPALSMNNSHMSLKRGGRIKRPETRTYEETFTAYLLKYSNHMKVFLQNFNPDTDALSVDYCFFFPTDLYFTKKNRLNLSKLPDVDNLIKITQDLVFKNLINDAYVVDLTACKLPTRKEAYIKVTIETVSLPVYAEEFSDDLPDFFD